MKTNHQQSIAVLLISAMSIISFSSKAASPAEENQKAWSERRILVLPRAGLPKKELAKILYAHGGTPRKVGQSDLYIVDLPANASAKAVAAQLAHHPHLKFAELDFRVSSGFIPNDPYYGSEWHLAKIGASSAWDVSQGEGVTIAILDSGVDNTHPDLAAQLVPGWNFFDNNANTVDVYGHGTAVAGTAAAASNNSTGVVSVAGKSKIMPIRVTDLNGGGYVSMISQGLVYAADRGVRVANISFAGVADSASIRSAAQYVKNKNGLVIVGAGNSGALATTTPTTTMIPVSATNANDQITSWSTYGDFVAVSAPGEGVWTTIKGGSYGAKSGTSFSSPVAAGVVALMMSAQPTMNNTQIENLLYTSATDLGSAGRDPYYGYGRVNATGAIQAAAAAAPAIDNQPPTVSISAPLDGSTATGVIPVDVVASDNVGVTRVELRVNGSVVAIDSTPPFGFSWDSTGIPNGMSKLVAYAFDAAGNATASSEIAVNVSNGATGTVKDTTPPVVSIVSPVAGIVTGSVTISTNASDNNGVAGISQALYIDGARVATGTGSTLGYNWNTRKTTAGLHTIQVTSKDAAGNAASASVQVSKGR